MFNLFKGTSDTGDKPKKPTMRIVQPKPGQSMEDLKAELEAEYGGDAQQGSIADMFKLLGKDALKTLQENGVDVDTLVANGVINLEDIPS